MVELQLAPVDRGLKRSPIGIEKRIRHDGPTNNSVTTILSASLVLEITQLGKGNEQAILSQSFFIKLSNSLSPTLSLDVVLLYSIQCPSHIVAPLLFTSVQ